MMLQQKTPRISLEQVTPRIETTPTPDVQIELQRPVSCDKAYVL